jgi:hypothetical protein
MKSRSIVGAGGTADPDGAVGAGVAGVAAAGACAAGTAELAGAGDADELREETLLDALAPGGDAFPAADGAGVGRTFGAAAARALAQLARLGASSFGPEASDFVTAAVEVGLLGGAAALATASPLVAG